MMMKNGMNIVNLILNFNMKTKQMKNVRKKANDTKNDFPYLQYIK